MGNINIPNRIVSVSLGSSEAPQSTIPNDPKPTYRGPVERPLELSGKTYKVAIPEKASWYVTINDLEDKPFEMFINTKNTEHYQWVTALTRVISAVFRQSEDPSFLIEELKSISDPTGGYFKKGKYVPSLVWEVGHIIEEHLNLQKPVSEVKGAPCPKCGEHSLIKKEGCESCLSCGYSKCG